MHRRKCTSLYNDSKEFKTSLRYLKEKKLYGKILHYLYNDKEMYYRWVYITQAVRTKERSTLYFAANLISSMLIWLNTNEGSLYWLKANKSLKTFMKKIYENYNEK